MGEHQVSRDHDEHRYQAFLRDLLADLCALEYMLEHGMFEFGPSRIGAEQELFLIDKSMRPVSLAMQVLEQSADPRLTTEIGKFNLEANLTPRQFAGSALADLEREIEEVLATARRAAESAGADILLTGILPTIRLSDLTLDNLTETARYSELNRSLCLQKGACFQGYIKGIDELQLTHDNVMMEACNTSFQIHFQVPPEEFPRAYNIAQLVTAPVLAAATNSPLLLGHRLWEETRIALFKHSVDARSSALQVRAQPTRVTFGEKWVERSVMELLWDDVTRFRVIMASESVENPMETILRGEAPKLSAFRLHNGTVWRWNRPCYGTIEGRPHLRIENRALPSGPTVVDEVANAAFFLGLVSYFARQNLDVRAAMAFDDAKNNFYAAARYGLRAELAWLNGATYPATVLIIDHLLPLANEGLSLAGIDAADASRYLEIIGQRVATGRTGSRWSLSSLAESRGAATPEVRLTALTRAMAENSRKGTPVHTWSLAEISPSEDWPDNYKTIGQFMSTDLFTVRAHDIVDLVARVMDWRHVRHVPVEDDEGRLVGLISHRDLLHFFAQRGTGNGADPVPVRSIMKANPISVTRETPTLEAIAIMRRHRIGCLPVVDGERLVGIVTAHDFLEPSAKLFEQHLTKLCL